MATFKKVPGRLHPAEFLPDVVRTGAEDHLVCGQRSLIREQVDVKEVTLLPEVVEDAGGEERPSKPAVFRTTL